MSAGHMGEVYIESGDILTETNAFQHWWCDESNDEVARERLVPDHCGVDSCGYVYLLHPVCACADRCTCNIKSVSRDLDALNL
jgi:hypothetical protein